MAADFKVWPCKKRLPKMRPTISTCRVDHVEWLTPWAGVGLSEEGADEFTKRVDRAKAAADRRAKRLAKWRDGE